VGGVTRSKDYILYGTADKGISTRAGLEVLLIAVG
jgi:hypothetical protein